MMIGIDTGGTYTDAVVFDEARGVVAKAKALTTRRDLSVGIAPAREGRIDPWPDGENAGFVQECFTCHTPVESRDYVFTTPIVLP